MAIVKPFRGFHYNSGKVTDLSAVLAPAWDLLQKESQKAAGNSCPENAARLLYPELAAEGPRPAISSWAEAGLLRRSSVAALYGYTVEFSPGGKRRTVRGFFARTPIGPPGTAGLFALQRAPEAALKVAGPEPREAAGDSVEPFTFLHDGADAGLDALLATCESGPPLLEIVDAEGSTHRIWEIAEPATIAAICQKMERARLLLAGPDTGYERLGGLPGASETAERFALFVPFESAGLQPQPVHRMLHVPDDFDFNHFFEQLGSSLDVYPLYGPDAIQGLLDKATPGEVRIVTFIAKPRRCLLMVPKATLPAFAPEQSDSWRKLDTAVLDGVVLGSVVGLTPEQQADPEILAYTRGVLPAVEQLQKGGRYRIAFMLNPARPSQIKELAFAGEPLPALSVEFHPRLPIGLLFDRQD